MQAARTKQHLVGRTFLGGEQTIHMYICLGRPHTVIIMYTVLSSTSYCTAVFTHPSRREYTSVRTARTNNYMYMYTVLSSTFYCTDGRLLVINIYNVLHCYYAFI